MINLNPDYNPNDILNQEILESTEETIQENDVETSEKNIMESFELFNEKSKIENTYNEAGKGVKGATAVINKHINPNIARGNDIVNSLDGSTVRNTSIVAKARNSVQQFPVYITQSIPVKEAHIISKMFERVYATLVQTVVAQNPILNEEEANNLVFLKNYHVNLKEAADVLYNKFYEPIDDIDAMMCESVFYEQQLSENCTVQFRVIPSDKQDELIQENARLMNEPLSGFIYLREAMDPQTTIQTTRKRIEIKDETTAEGESELSKIAKSWKANLSDEQKKAYGVTEDNYLDKWRKLAKKGAFENGDGGKIAIIYDTNTGKFYKSVVDSLNTSKNNVLNAPKSLDAPKLLHDADIKKINGMLPYTVELTFLLKSNNGLLQSAVKYVIGVKTVMHLIKVEDLKDDLRDLITGQIKTLQKVRYKTGELSFKDYMFDIKGAKAAAAKKVKGGARWINTLKRLAQYNKTNGSLLRAPLSVINKGDVPIPNGTLILSQTDVTLLTNETGIDLGKVANAKRLAKSLFLITVAIVDASAGTMKVLFTDNDVDWDIQSLASIDAEVSKTDNSALMQALNKAVNR